MMPENEPKKVYTRRVNSNGDDVSPTITCTISKGVQRQLDNGGGYVLDYYIVRKRRKENNAVMTEENE